MHTPIVAKPTEEAETISNYAASVEICIFDKSVIDATTKGYNYPI